MIRYILAFMLVASAALAQDQLSTAENTALRCTLQQMRLEAQIVSLQAQLAALQKKPEEPAK